MRPVQTDTEGAEERGETEPGEERPSRHVLPDKILIVVDELLVEVYEQLRKEKSNATRNGRRVWAVEQLKLKTDDPNAVTYLDAALDDLYVVLEGVC